MSAIPATLDDVLDSVRASFSRRGRLRDVNTNPGGVEMLRGERYLRQEGAPPRVIFVCASGNIGGPIAIGARQTASITESVRCYIWGAETDDDAGRISAARSLAMELINTFKAWAGGRLTGGSLERSIDTNVETFGEEYQLVYNYIWGVPEDEGVWADAYANAVAASPPNPDKPNGDTGATFGIGAITLTNTRP